MNLKGMLRVSTSLMVCGAIFSSFAHAEDYITKSQVNTANGVAGLNANKEVTADVNGKKVVATNINSQQVNTPYLILPTITDPESKDRSKIRYATGDNDPNNSDINIYYNKDATTDPWKNQLDANTLYFTNNHGGNNYKFVGNVAATGDLNAHKLVLNGYNVIDPIPGGYEEISSYYQPGMTPANPDGSFLFINKNDIFVRKDTLMVGGNTRNANVGIKAKCQTTSGSDEGGVCFQFINMSGSYGQTRSGTGATEATNMEVRTGDNSPIDVIGGNVLKENSDGTYVVDGNNYDVYETTKEKANTFQIKGTFGCGIQDPDIILRKQGINAQLKEPMPYIKYGCVMTGMDVIDATGNKINAVNVTPGTYDQVNDTTIVQLPKGYELAQVINVDKTASGTVIPSINIKYYSSDEVAYAVKFQEKYVEIYPALSAKENNLLQSRMALWTNYVNGMFSVEDPTTLGAGVDMPNYYFGYYSGGANEGKYTRLNVETYYYPGGDSKGGWKNIHKTLVNPASTAQSAPGTPGQNTNDQLDNRLSYTCVLPEQLKETEDEGQLKKWQDDLASGKLTDAEKQEIETKLKEEKEKQLKVQEKFRFPEKPACYDQLSIKSVVKASALQSIEKSSYKYNTNYHRYSQPTLFLGLTQKNFNTYYLQNYGKSSDSLTREFDNEWDYWIKADHDYEVSSKGLTMSWSSINKDGKYGEADGKKKLTPGSYMLLLSGVDIMPTGLRVTSVWEDGGKFFDTDGGFSVFHWIGSKSRQILKEANSEQVINALGQAETNKGSYQLFSYMSNDNPNVTPEDSMKNNSFHFGITKNMERNLRFNYSPTCRNKKPYNQNQDLNPNNCSVLGQLIFDPLGYVGGIALGSGQGENTKLGVIVDKDGNVIINKDLSVGGKSLSDAIVTAENAIPKTQINVANGVAGLNKDKEVTADINSKKVVAANINSQQVNTPYLILPTITDPESKDRSKIRYATGDNDPNNSDINIYYNKDVTTDPWKNQLDANTLYFTNNHAGNNYKFVGNVAATGKLSATSIQVSNIKSEQVTTPIAILPTTGFIRYLTGDTSPLNTDINIYYNKDAKTDPWQNQLDANTLYFTNNHGGNNYKFVGNVATTGKLSASTLNIKLSTPSSSAAACNAGDIKDDANYHYVCVAANKWKRVALSDF